MSEKLGDGIFSRNKNKYEARDGKWAVIAGKDKHPDYTGRVTLKVGGGEIDCRVSGWIRKSSKDGKPFMSLQLEYANDESRRLVIAASQPGTMPPAPPDELPEVGDEELPF